MTRVILALVFVSTLAMGGQFSTALGDQYPYTISAITTDAAGNAYVVGARQIGTVISPVAVVGDVAGAPKAAVPGTSDVFVSKLDPNGNLLFTDTFAGKGTDRGIAIALDPSGNIYIAGTTTSSDFPLSGALQTQTNPLGTGFVLKLSNGGTTILYSTYFGGALGQSAVTGLATDSQGNLYLTGTTTSSDFPHTPGLPFGPSPLAESNTAVLFSCISANGDKILYSGAFISGPLPVSGASSPSSGGVAVDAAGNAYFAGSLGAGLALPTTPGVLTPTAKYGGFAAKVNPGGNGLAYLTYLPSSVSSIALDSMGDLYLAGTSFPFDNAPLIGFVAKLNPAASAFLWTNNFNLFYETTTASIAVDSSGNAWVAGTTTWPTFPNQGWTTGPEFLAEISAAGNQIYSALYPAGTSDSLAIDPAGLLHIAGSGGFVSVQNPSTTPATAITYLQNVFGGAVTSRLSPAEVISIYGPGIGPPTAITAVPVNGFYAKTLGTVQVTINGLDMPVLYASANQINAIVPMEAISDAGVTIRVINGSSPIRSFPVWIDASEGHSFPTVLNQDLTINSQSNPAMLNSVVTFYATGWQSEFAPLADGQVATVAQNTCQSPAPSVCGVFPLNTLPTGIVLYAGAAPGIVAGVTQFNVEITADNAIISCNFVGQYSFTVNALGASVSQTVWVKC
jgi:uncharacterized protein (TIGR03437 family)